MLSKQERVIDCCSTTMAELSVSLQAILSKYTNPVSIQASSKSQTRVSNKFLDWNLCYLWYTCLIVRKEVIVDTLTDNDLCHCVPPELNRKKYVQIVLIVFSTRHLHGGQLLWLGQMPKNKYFLYNKVWAGNIFCHYYFNETQGTGAPWGT